MTCLRGMVAGLVLMASPAVAADYEIRLAHSLSTTEPAHQAALFYAEHVAERSGGQIEITVFPGEQLGSGKDVNQMIRQGANVMNITDAGYLADFVPDVGVLHGPYLVDSPEEYNKILTSDWHKQIDQQLRDQGLRVVSWNGLFGGRHMIADKPIRTPEDMAGMTVRVPPNSLWLATFEAIGARPTTVQWSEVYNALSQNVVASAEAPLGSLYGSKLYEVKKTLSLTRHFTSFLNFVGSETYLSSLPQDLQDILMEEGYLAGEYMTKLTQEREAQYLDDFRKAGVEVVEDVDIEAFRAKTESVYTSFPDWTPGLKEQIDAIISQ
ncbi:C4-dicarboxylate TRAP transporter substrate-binding protein [Marinivivus vitaminiproducens]|uniref:C4-dicarboxylate TRAP transporter substrate-binding protein n=1 Tax=Marinivivus vitaminiproducens TaxID=3035935 RepID=UPI0027981657|nr:C4-dicarboxylate TRAP transporter substrate-binding protein [Geminicoccaceae bacterium SCSIO 64248]